MEQPGAPETVEHPRSQGIALQLATAVLTVIVVVAGAAAVAHYRPSSSAKVHLGSPRWTVGFDGGETASFQAPAGMRRTACCATYHVGLAGTGASAPTLDVATDDSPNTVAHDLHALAVQESTYDARYDGTSGPISYLKLDGHNVAQYAFTYRLHSARPIREMVTLMLVGHEELSFYWAQDAQHFSESVARDSEDAVVGSLRFGPST